METKNLDVIREAIQANGSDAADTDALFRAECMKKELLKQAKLASKQQEQQQQAIAAAQAPVSDTASAVAALERAMESCDIATLKAAIAEHAELASETDELEHASMLLDRLVEKRKDEKKKRLKDAPPSAKQPSAKEQEAGNGDSKEAATLALNPKTGKGTQDGKRVDDAGATYYAKSLTGSPGSASALNGRKGGNIPSIRLAGKWSDPMHPGCTRKIQLSAGKAFIAGSDEDGKPWKVVGTVTGNDIIIDFSPKGGPKDVKATFVIGKGITFPDGNVWSRIS
ncbi:hypothetical protein Ctob_015260 [Chrysochromulina tobinii]|uniref:Uncharacterized protein n=1 Tax=Chrysochromulina tobinii TaxID=1460289 RepID=A0A0M0K0N4_9EUKA|nr:hypothetical protein Ctob_015260 [Chrysochromulina tobinii]|eukprot:KOO32147.1 hypothetical protein Ctob_015260 [Chrysochromulina sp. CCMP291]